MDREVSEMFDMGADTLDLPLEEKMKYEQGDNGDSFGFVPLFNLSFHLSLITTLIVTKQKGP